GGSSHHVQGELTDAKCYQCHWEANSNGTINPAYHGGAAAPGSPVDLVVYGAAARPTTFTAGATAVQYTANGTRGEIEKVTSHCLGCHSDQNNSATPFGDGKTPKQYAWDGTSVAARYAQTGKTTWGKYSTVTNAAQKRIAKSLSAHGNAAANQRGWNTTTGVDGAITNTSGGTGVQCYDCHNSHGSSVAGITSRYSSATGNKRGGL
ncbi:MAG: CxxxxCH/CxxCH domain-containing protein, partial [Geobacter sp.]